ncbi:hypothetical protein E3N88_22983 [Mikania micrantha]|uniref:Uncharacterized protein n=1 Tax=Mikania micrantha TaxID=192012 RepID=A0A5N6NC11_9ASTR|nr:hypothetical protein E3N88_22983 [Mikania micrantha]
MIQRSLTIVNCSVLIRILQRQECTIFPGFRHHKPSFRNQLLGYRNQHLTSRFKSQDAAAWEMWHKPRLDSYTNWLESRRQPPGRRIGRFSADIRYSMIVTYASTLLGRNTVMLMGIAAEIPRVGLRWSLDRHTEWVPPVPAPQQQPGAQPHVQEPTADQPPADQPLPPPHHVVVRQPRLHTADAAILRDLLGSVRDLSGRVDRLEGMMRWMTERMAASAGMDVPVFPGPGHDQDPQDPPLVVMLSYFCDPVTIPAKGPVDVRATDPCT